MMRNLYIDDQPGYIRAALVEDGVLSELLSEQQSEADQTESMYLGRVQAIRTSVNAAFVDIGSGQNAFLPMDERMKLRCGDMIIVQGAAKQTTDSKGLRVTERISLAGRWLALLPGGGEVRISKKVKEPALRARLFELGREICPTGCGLIVRTASGDATEERLREEALQLEALWREIGRKASGMAKPGLLHQPEPLYMRLARDLREVSGIYVSSNRAFEALSCAQKEQKIDPDAQIVRYEEREQLIFDAFAIETQIDKALKKRVWLPCGGYLIIDPCEAMTVIDVNSGKMTLGRDTEDTALHVNLEAAEEIARQIRLRDIGGIIVIDFIDMREEQHRRQLVDRMKQAVSADRSPVKIEGLTRLGLMEMTRRRVHHPLRKVLRTACSYCGGCGEVLSGEEVARRALRQVRRLLLSGQRGPFVVRCAPAAAQALSRMETPDEGTQVFALAVSGRHAERFDIEQTGAGTPVPKEAAALRSRGI